MDPLACLTQLQLFEPRAAFERFNRVDRSVAGDDSNKVPTLGFFDFFPT